MLSMSSTIHTKSIVVWTRMNSLFSPVLSLTYMNNPYCQSIIMREDPGNNDERKDERDLNQSNNGAKTSTFDLKAMVHKKVDIKALSIPLIIISFSIQNHRSNIHKKLERNTPASSKQTHTHTHNINYRKLSTRNFKNNQECVGTSTELTRNAVTPALRLSPASTSLQGLMHQAAYQTQGCGAPERI